MSSANGMKARSAQTDRSYPVATMIAPKTKNVSTWKIVRTFSVKSANCSVISCSEAPSAIAATKAATRPLPKVTSARPKAARPIPIA